VGLLYLYLYIYGVWAERTNFENRTYWIVERKIRAVTVIWKRKPLSSFCRKLALVAAMNPSQVRSE